MAKEDFVIVGVTEDNVLTTNVEKLVKNVYEVLPKYDYVVTEQNYKLAKTDRASLNSLYKDVQSERKAFEKDTFAQWNHDKKIIMDLEKRIKELADSLGAGMADVDQKEKDIKLGAIKRLWEEKADDIKKIYVKFDTIYNKRWMNKTYELAKIETDMDEIVAQVNKDLELMELFLPKEDFEREQVLLEYENTLDIGVAKAKAEQLEKIKEQVKEKKKEKPKEDIQKPICFGNPDLNGFDDLPIETEEQAKRYAVFRIEGSYEAFVKVNSELPKLFKELGITFKVIEKGEM